MGGTGKDRRGRHRRRTHGDKKDKGKDDKNQGKGRNDAPPQSNGPFRASALTVVNTAKAPWPPMTLNCTFYYRIKTGLDDYGPPVASVERTLGTGESFRYAPNPDRYRVGVRIKRILLSADVYADVRNVSFWFPTGGVTGARISTCCRQGGQHVHSRAGLRPGRGPLVDCAETRSESQARLGHPHRVGTVGYTDLVLPGEASARFDEREGDARWTPASTGFW